MHACTNSDAERGARRRRRSRVVSDSVSGHFGLFLSSPLGSMFLERTASSNAARRSVRARTRSCSGARDGQLALASRKRLRAARRRLQRPEKAFPREPRPTRVSFFPSLFRPVFFKIWPGYQHFAKYHIRLSTVTRTYPSQTTTGRVSTARVLKSTRDPAGNARPSD